MNALTAFDFDNSYARLPERFFARLDPTPPRAPKHVRINDALARQLGIDPDALRTPEGIEILAGKRVPTGAAPLAMAYAGHQFGSFVPQLGDGRAILLGELVDTAGVRYDIHMKGTGRTPFSRMGDGRAALGPVLREYIVSESMAALGVPTTRALAAVTTGEEVFRETALPGAVLTRVAQSHVRIGTFQFFAARQDEDALRQLADYVIDRHYPAAAMQPEPYLALLEAVIERQAALVARWMGIGFIHGVMNTDNMSVAGETIDYGPCAFMDTYHPATVYSSIDHTGRYAFANQPPIAHWNLSRLAQAILPLLDSDEDAAVEKANTALSGFADRFNTCMMAGLREKLGLAVAEEDDMKLAQDLLDRMAGNQADYTLTFRGLATLKGPETFTDPADDAPVRDLFDDPAAFDAWAAAWRARLDREARPDPERQAAMRQANPAFIPRNHLVEAAIAAAVERDDLSVFESLLEVLATPFEDRPDRADFARPPRPEEIVRQTFCGT